MHYRSMYLYQKIKIKVLAPIGKKIAYINLRIAFISEYKRLP